MASLADVYKYTGLPTAAQAITNNIIKPQSQTSASAGAKVINTPNQSAINMANQQFAPQQQIDPMAYINQLKQAQIANAVSNLDKQRSSALSSLDAEKAQIQPMAYNDRNSANVAMNNSNRAWDEYMASKYGSSKAGVEDLGVGMNLSQYQGQIGTINQNATNREADIARRVTEVNNNYASDLAAAQSSAEATALQNFLNQANTDKQFNYQASRDAVSDNRYNTQYADNKTNQAKQDYISTIGQFSNDYQAEINKIKNDGIASNDWQLPYLQNAKNDKVANQQALQAKANEMKTALQQQQFENALAAWKTSGTASQAISQILGVPVGAKTADYNISSINAATSRQSANTSARNASTSASRFAYEKDKDVAEATNKTYNNYLNMGNDRINAGTTNDGVFTPRYTNDQIVEWIRGLNLTSAEKAKLANDLGL